MDIWIVSAFGLLSTVLLYAHCVEIFVWKYVLFILMGTYLGAELLDHIKTLCLIF